jgi:hypothetical protein
MVVPDGESGAVGRDAHAVIGEANAAGVYVVGGGIDEGVLPVPVSADGTVAMGGYPWAPRLDGGFSVSELPSRDEAVTWAARIARACRCDQELRVFGFDPQSQGRPEMARHLRPNDSREPRPLRGPASIGRQAATAARRTRESGATARARTFDHNARGEVIQCRACCFLR